MRNYRLYLNKLRGHVIIYLCADWKLCDLGLYLFLNITCQTAEQVLHLIVAHNMLTEKVRRKIMMSAKKHWLVYLSELQIFVYA